MPRSRGYVTAVAIGVITVSSVAGIFSIATGNPLNLRGEWSVLLFQMLLVSVPFGLMARAGVSDGMAWFVGVALTAALWGYYLFVGIRYQLGDHHGGVDIGLALLMLVSPAFISAACFVVARFRKAY